MWHRQKCSWQLLLPFCKFYRKIWYPYRIIPRPFSKRSSTVWTVRTLVSHFQPSITYFPQNHYFLTLLQIINPYNCPNHYSLTVPQTRTPLPFTRALLPKSPNHYYLTFLQSFLPKLILSINLLPSLGE